MRALLATDIRATSLASSKDVGTCPYHPKIRQGKRLWNLGSRPSRVCGDDRWARKTPEPPSRCWNLSRLDSRLPLLPTLLDRSRPRRKNLGTTAYIKYYIGCKSIPRSGHGLRERMCLHYTDGQVGSETTHMRRKHWSRDSGRCQGKSKPATGKGGRERQR